MTNKELVAKMLKVLEDVVEINNEANVGICKKEDNTDVYVLGENIFASPIEIYMQKEKGFYGVFFFDTMDAKNWSWELRQPFKGYFIHEGKFYTQCGETKAMLVPTTQVLKELKESCEWFMKLKNFKSPMVHMGWKK